MVADQAAKNIAQRLGADYPFADDKLAASQFDTYLSLAHGASRPRS